MKILIIFLTLLLYLHAEEDLSLLLNDYKHESELSKITKQEEAGIIDIYTRHDLEMMQARTFEDVLKVIPGFHFTRTSNNLTTFEKPSMGSTQLTSLRLYINDHDMSSSSFGTAFLIWGELPIEYIDHIEVYKGAASVEFGNETSTVIIKLYTKQPKREEGGKIRLSADNYGSSSLDAYMASQNGDFSYFAYANANNINREEYENVYEGTPYALKSDHSGHNLYANLKYLEWNLELGSYTKDSDSFLGIGTNRTPTGGGLEADHHYLHLTKKFKNDIKLQLSYDNIAYDRAYLDPNGINIANGPIINNYCVNFKDEIFSAVLEKKFNFDKHSLLLGGFYKRKKFDENGNFYDDALTYYYDNKLTNALDMYSLYGEYTYDYDSSTKFLTSLKGDFIQYDKAIPSYNELIAKLGVIKYVENLKIKLFLTKTYSPTAFYQLYNPENTPYKTNPNLDNMHITIETLSLSYKIDKHNFKLVIAENQIKDSIVYDRSLPYGYTNSPNTVDYTYVELGYDYLFNADNKFTSTLFYGGNSTNNVFSPQYEAMFQLFTKYKKFDIYNALTYKNSYEYVGLTMSASYDYTASVKYHYTKDLSFGLRGENIFNSGYEQAYRGLDYSIPVVDQKFWLNMEYLF
jgi:iron complex outermembrane receptor protein